MDKRKLKLDSQLRLIASLREFIGPVPAGHFTPKEFFIVSLQRIGANIEEFKREKLRELVDGLAAGPKDRLSEDAASRFTEKLAKLVSGQDLGAVSAGLAGSREFLLQRLSRLQPLSVAAEERKRPGEMRDPATDRLVGDAYLRMGFDKLEKESAAGRPDDEVLAQARERAAQHCALNKLPESLESTMPHLMLSCIDAVTGACFRLLAGMKKNGKGQAAD